MLNLAEILGATKGKIVGGIKRPLITKGVSTDSRKLTKGELFVAIVGEKFDGHDFLIAAVRRGASAIIIDEKHFAALAKKNPKLFNTDRTNPANKKLPIIIKVSNTLAAYQQIALKWRKKFKIPVIGITGSAGKTTTKDLLASILNEEMNVLFSEANHNNEMGVPETLLRLKPGHKAAVIEMAAQKPGEIKPLAAIVRPTMAIITCIGEAHLEFFKNKEAVAKTKSEIFSYLKKGNPVILNADDAFAKKIAGWASSKSLKVVTYGLINPAKINEKELCEIHMPIPGKHNLYNALAAIAAAKQLKLTSHSIKKGLEKARLSSNRSEAIELPYNIILINDCYNANPTSMIAALKMTTELANLHGSYPVAILGDLLELGKAAVKAHKEIGKFCRKHCIKVIGVGKLAKHYDCCGHFRTSSEVIPYLTKILKANSVVLVKGSRGIHLEKIVEAAKKLKK